MKPLGKYRIEMYLFLVLLFLVQWGCGEDGQTGNAVPNGEMKGGASSETTANANPDNPLDECGERKDGLSTIYLQSQIRSWEEDEKAWFGNGGFYGPFPISLTLELGLTGVGVDHQVDADFFCINNHQVMHPDFTLKDPLKNIWELKDTVILEDPGRNKPGKLYLKYKVKGSTTMQFKEKINITAMGASAVNSEREIGFPDHQYNRFHSDVIEIPELFWSLVPYTVPKDTIKTSPNDTVYPPITSN